MTTYFAAIDPDTSAVHGIGCTEAEALSDATREVGDNAATLLTVPMTTAAFVHVEEHGGAPSSRLTVSRSGVMLRSEEA